MFESRDPDLATDKSVEWLEFTDLTDVDGWLILLIESDDFNSAPDGLVLQTDTSDLVVNDEGELMEPIHSDAILSDVFRATVLNGELRTTVWANADSLLTAFGGELLVTLEIFVASNFVLKWHFFN